MKKIIVSLVCFVSCAHAMDKYYAMMRNFGKFSCHEARECFIKEDEKRYPPKTVDLQFDGAKKYCIASSIINSQFAEFPSFKLANNRLEQLKHGFLPTLHTVHSAFAHIENGYYVGVLSKGSCAEDYQNRSMTGIICDSLEQDKRGRIIVNIGDDHEITSARIDTDETRLVYAQGPYLIQTPVVNANYLFDEVRVHDKLGAIAQVCLLKNKHIGVVHQETPTISVYGYYSYHPKAEFIAPDVKTVTTELVISKSGTLYAVLSTYWTRQINYTTKISFFDAQTLKEVGSCEVEGVPCQKAHFGNDDTMLFVSTKNMNYRRDTELGARKTFGVDVLNQIVYYGIDHSRETNFISELDGYEGATLESGQKIVKIFDIRKPGNTRNIETKKIPAQVLINSDVVIAAPDVDFGFEPCEIYPHKVTTQQDQCKPIVENEEASTCKLN